MTTAAPPQPPAPPRPPHAQQPEPTQPDPDLRPATSTAPTARTLWLWGRGPLLAVVVLLGVSLVAAALRSSGDGGRLDPRSYAPGGARAAATLLADQGVPVRVVGDLPSLRAALTGRTTVLVPTPDTLTGDELAALPRLGAGSLVVLGAGPAELDALGLPVSAVDTGAPTRTRQPACDLPAAVTAGTTRAGGTTYAVEPGTPAVTCYAAAGDPTLVSLTAARTVLVGSSEPFTNDALDRDGDAALALGLLGGGDQVLWLVPAAGRAVPGGRLSVRDLLPDGVVLGTLQLGIAVVLLALWRARRLGPVVQEPLPVVVRAAEAVEGRARLYRAAAARGTAAESLRAGARDRLARRLGLAADASRAALVEGLAARSGRHPGEVDALLYGAPPADDAALVRLADGLDDLQVS